MKRKVSYLPDYANSTATNYARPVLDYAIRSPVASETCHAMAWLRDAFTGWSGPPNAREDAEGTGEAADEAGQASGEDDGADDDGAQPARSVAEVAQQMAEDGELDSKVRQSSAKAYSARSRGERT